MKPYLKTLDHSVSKEAFDLYWDEDLDMLCTRPQPQDLAPYYDSGDYISHTDAKNSLFERIYQAVKRINLNSKLQYIDNQNDKIKTLLDIGAGTGDFLLKAKSKGFQVQGMEPNAKARELALQKGVALAADWNQIPADSYRYITLWHVLEHLPDLETEIQRIVSHLEPDGTLIVAVPNFKSFDAQYYGSHWAGYDVPRHLWHFSRTSIAKLFGAHGMEIHSIKPMWFDAFYVSLLSEKYRGSSWSWIRGFWVGLRSNLKAMHSGEHSSLIYVLKRKK